MNLYAISSITAFAISFLLSLLIYLKGIRDKLRRASIFVIICIGTWCLFPFFAWAFWPGKSLFFTRLTYLAAIFAAPAFLNFGLTILNIQNEPKENKLIKGSIIISMLFFLPFLFSSIFIREIKKADSHFSIMGGPIYAIFVFYFGAVCLYCFLKLYLGLKNSSGFRRNQLRYVFTGFLLAFLGGLIHFATAIGIPEFFPHDILIVACMVTLTYAILKYHLMDINIAITRVGIFIIVYALVLGIPFGLAGWEKEWLIQIFGQGWFWIPMAVLLGFASAGPFIFMYLQRRAERALLKDQRRYQKALIELSKTMGRIRDIDKLLRIIVLTIVDKVKVPFAGIYLKDEAYKSYHRKHYFPKKEESRFQECIPLDSPLVNQLNEKKKPLLSDEVDYQDVIKLDSGLVIPCFIEDVLLGFLVLGPKPSHQMYTPDDALIFETLSYSTSLAIENSQFWKEIEDRQRQARIQEMDIFAYSVAHEIQNPMHIILNQIRFLKDYLLKYITNEEDRKAAEDSCYFVSDACQRTSGMVEAVQAAGKKVEGGPEPLNIADVIENVLKLYQPIFKDKGIFFTKELPENIPLILGYMPLLMHLFINFSNNSIHALMYAPVKKINLKVELPNPDWIRIVFSDTGYGITKDFLPIIFNPFTTTKASTEGTGMGLHIVKTIVTRHKGKIWAESEGKDKGATFFVELPVAKDIGPEKPKGFDKSKRLF